MQVQAVLQTAKRLREADLWKEENRAFTRRSSLDEEHVVLFFPGFVLPFYFKSQVLDISVGGFASRNTQCHDRTGSQQNFIIHVYANSFRSTTSVFSHVSEFE